jgi:DNA-binding CsgD family transcriptional regulator
VIREARASVKNIPVTPATTRKQIHRVNFDEVLRLAADGLNTTQIAHALGHPVGTIRTSIRLHNYRWQRTDNRWTLGLQAPNDDRRALADQIAAFALAGSTNIEISDELGCSVHRIPRLLALAGYRRTRGMHTRVVSTRRTEDSQRPALSPTLLSARRLAALIAPDRETHTASATA